MPMGIVFWLLVGALREADALNRYVCHAAGEGKRVCMCPRVKCVQSLPYGCGLTDTVGENALQQIGFFPSTRVVKTPRQKVRLALSLADSPGKHSIAAEQLLGGHAPC